MSATVITIRPPQGRQRQREITANIAGEHHHVIEADSERPGIVAKVLVVSTSGQAVACGRGVYEVAQYLAGHLGQPVHVVNEIDEGQSYTIEAPKLVS